MLLLVMGQWERLVCSSRTQPTPSLGNMYLQCKRPPQEKSNNATVQCNVVRMLLYSVVTMAIMHVQVHTCACTCMYIHVHVYDNFNNEYGTMVT